MTKINRLTQIPTLDDSDLAVVWQDSSERTRAITIANLRNFIQSTDPNSDAFVKAELIGDELVLTSHDEVETRIDINLLPEHSVTELKDMPDELIAGNYLKVSDDGTEFVLTPASEISAAVLVREGGQLKGLANVLDFGNAAISLENRIARINSGLLIDDQFVTKIYTENDLDVLIEDEVATISINNQVSPWPIEEVGIGDSPKVIDKVEHLGIEYQFEASSTFTQSVHLYHVGLPEGAQIKVTVVNAEPNSKPIDVFQLSSGSDLRWPVITPTVFTLRSGLWRVEESSQLLHVANATTFDDDAARKKIVHGVAVEPNSPITMDVNDDGVLVIGGGGVSDEPTFKSVNIDTNVSGQPNFTASIYQDNELHTVIDATRELRVNYKDIGTGLTTGVMGIDNNQAQFLVPIYQGNDPVALAKDIPNTSNFIVKHTNAELNKLFCAYQGKYNENRAFYPIGLYQDVNGWTQLEFTGNMLFKSKGKDTGTVGDKVLEVKQSRVVAHKDFEVLGNTIYDGDTSQPTNLINRQALDDEPQKEWFPVANGTLTTNGNRPTGDSGVEGELAVWHNVTSDSTTDPANELKIVFDGAYEKVDEFSKPLRFRLSQQGGSRNQYWTVDDNGWQTEGNVWHLSASKVTGDNLVVGIDTTIQASALFLADVSDEINEKIAADKAKGEWIGGVYKDTINDDGNPDDDFTCNNPKHWLEYRKTTFQGDYALNVIQGDTPISSEIVIHLHPSSGMNSTQFRVVTNDGKAATKTVRLGEKWRFLLRKGTWPYYERIDDGTSGYILEDEFNAKSGYSALESGGGSTKTITYADNGKIIKVSNSTVKVEMLQGMNAEDKKHGYFKYINARNADVDFEWYDRNGNQVTSNVPSVCPADTVVEIFADYAKDQYVLTFGQSKVISSVGEEQVQQIVSKSFDSLLEPGEGTAPFSKHPLPNQQGYLSTYSSVMYDAEDRLVIPRNAYDRSLMELFFEANKSTAYCTLPVATVELLLGRILRPEDIELGVALEELTAITPGIYGATTPSNVPSTWSWNGKFIPIDTEEGERNDPNNPTVWLSQDGDYVYSESEAGDKPKYGQMNVSDLMSKDGQTWRHALRRGYVMKDGSFVFNAESPYYVFVIRISGYQTPQSKIHTTFFNRGGIKLYPDAISAYVDQEKIREQLDELSEGLAQGFIYAKEVSVG